MSYLGFVIGDVNNLDSSRRSLPFQIYINGPTGQLIDSVINNAKFTIKTDSDSLQSASV